MKKRYVSSLQRKMFALAFLTSAFTEFTQIIALTVDSVIVCRFLGEKEIAAVGISGPFFFLVGILASCLSSGLQTICSQELGRGHLEDVSQRFSETVLWATVCLSALTAVVFLTVPQIAFLFGARGKGADLHALTCQYLYGLGFEMVPFVLMSVLTSVVVLDNGSSAVMLSSILGCVINIGFDILSVRCRWGLFGIGLSSSISVVVSLLILLLHFCRKDRSIRFRLVRIRWKGIREVLRLGLPKAIHSMAGMLRAWLLNALVIHLGGSVAMSVLTINGTIMDFVEILPVGFAGAVSVLSGISYGEMNGEEMEGVGILAHRYILFFSALMMGLLISLNSPIARFFLSPVSSGYPLLQFVIFCIAANIVANSLICSRVSYLQAKADAKNAQHLEAAGNMILLVGFALGLSSIFGIKGVFLAFPVSKLVCLLLVYIYNARRAGKLIPTVQEYMGLAPNFYSSARDVISYPIKTTEECVLASEQVGLFCCGHKFDKRSAYLAAVCVEEIATNVLQHGGKNDKELPLAEIRVTIVENQLIFRIRDNGKSFQLSTMAKLLADEKDPAASLGLKIVCAAADDISYYRIYGMNTTIIRIRNGLEKAAA